MRAKRPSSVNSWRGSAVLVLALAVGFVGCRASHGVDGELEVAEFSTDLSGSGVWPVVARGSSFEICAWVDGGAIPGDDDDASDDDDATDDDDDSVRSEEARDDEGRDVAPDWTLVSAAPDVVSLGETRAGVITDLWGEHAEFCASADAGAAGETLIRLQASSGVNRDLLGMEVAVAERITLDYEGRDFADGAVALEVGTDVMLTGGARDGDDGLLGIGGLGFSQEEGTGEIEAVLDVGRLSLSASSAGTPTRLQFSLEDLYMALSVRPVDEPASMTTGVCRGSVDLRGGTASYRVAVVLFSEALEPVLGPVYYTQLVQGEAELDDPADTGFSLTAANSPAPVHVAVGGGELTELVRVRDRAAAGCRSWDDLLDDAAGSSGCSAQGVLPRRPGLRLLGLIGLVVGLLRQRV